jgi:biotin/methionine sulfoxide reductase
MPTMPAYAFPTLAHWGAYTALVENGRVIGCEPFARDPAPSTMLEAIPAMVHSPLRIARPAIREGWREGKERTGSDRYREVSWDEALSAVGDEIARVRAQFGNTAILGGSYGWSSAGRVHHARSLLRRFLFLGGGCVDQVANYSFGAAQYILPRVIGTFQPVVGDHGLGLHRQACALMIAFGGLALKNAQVTRAAPGAQPGDWLRRAKEAGVSSFHQPAESDAPTRRAMDPHSAEHRHRASCRHGAHAVGGRAP